MAAAINNLASELLLIGCKQIITEMETKKIVLVFLLLIVFSSGFSQKVTRKERRDKTRSEKQHLIDNLVNNKEFVFVADRALPQSGSPVDLTTNANSLAFHPDKIVSYMPFFGRAYSVDYGGDAGIKFEAKPQEFTVKSIGKKGYNVTATVTTTHDKFNLNLMIGPEGSSTLTIISNQRSTISYIGEIKKVEQLKER